MRTLRDADKLVHETIYQLDDLQNWDLELLQRVCENQKYRDSLDQLVACAQTLTEDIRQTSSFIQGNALLLFKRTISPNSAMNGTGEWTEDDCDYVSLESREPCVRKRADLRQELRPDKRFDRPVEGSVGGVFEIGANDRTLLEYYAQQAVTHIKYFNQAIDGILLTVEHNQPPKVFLAHGKLVVLSAYNLVSIGDWRCRA